MKTASGTRIAAVVAALLLPVSVFAMLIIALQNPQERLHDVRAAIVNEDEPVEVDGELAPLGRQLAAGLVEGADNGEEGAADSGDDINYAWELTDADRASEGLEDGRFNAVVTIGEDFSAAATSLSGDASQARQGDIDVQTAPNAAMLDDALARIVTATAAQVIGHTLTGTYVDGMLVGFTTLHEELGTASDGADDLAQGAAEAADGAAGFADGTEELADGVPPLADGAGALADGVGSSAAGAGQLSAGVDGAAAGAGELSAGVGGAAAGAGELSAGVGGGAAGAADLAEGASASASGARQLADGVGQAAAGARELAAPLPQLVDGAQQVAQGNRELADQAAGLRDVVVPQLSTVADGLREARQEVLTAAGCDSADAPEECAQLREALDFGVQEADTGLAEAEKQLKVIAGSTDQLADGAEAVATGVAGVRGGVDGLTEGLDALEPGAQELASGLGALETGASELTGGLGQLGSGADELAGGLGQLGSGADELAGGLGQLGSGADELAGGLGQLAPGAQGIAEGTDGLVTGTRGVADGAGELADGVDELSGGSRELADGLHEAVQEIPSYTASERDNLSTVAAEPVSGPGVDGVRMGESGPLFATIALWLGGLGIMFVFRATPQALLASRQGSARLVAEALVRPGLAGGGTGVVVGLMLAAAESLSPPMWIACAGMGAVVGTVFVAVQQALHLAFGRIGGLIALLVAMLLFATGMVSAIPPALMTIRELLPVGPAMDLFSAVALPGVSGLTGAVVVLLLWGAAAFVASTLLVARRRGARVAQLIRSQPRT